MGEFLFWSLVLSGTPLALALLQRAVEWSRDAIRTRMVAWESLPGSDCQVAPRFFECMCDAEWTLTR
jgi:hypothetical protein